MKKITLLIIISVFSKTGITGTRPDYGKIAIKGMENSFKSVPKAVGIMNKKFNENSPPEKNGRRLLTATKKVKNVKQLTATSIIENRRAN
jgi:hypothetical protein